MGGGEKDLRGERCPAWVFDGADRTSTFALQRIEGSWRKYVKEGKEEDAKEKDETKKAILYYRKRFNPGARFSSSVMSTRAMGLTFFFGRLASHQGPL